jgi:hypothetical protein
VPKDLPKHPQVILIAAKDLVADVLRLRQAHFRTKILRFAQNDVHALEQTAKRAFQGHSLFITLAATFGYTSLRILVVKLRTAAGLHLAAR